MLKLPRWSGGAPDRSPNARARGTPRLHYAWVIIVISALMWMITSPVMFTTSLLIPYLQDPQGFGWSYFSISIAFALQWLCLALYSPLVGWLSDRYGVRCTMVLGACVFLVGMLLTGSMTQLWHFYLFFGVLLAMPMTVFHIPLVAGVAIWFRTRIGLAMGILQACQGMGTVLATPIISVLFATWGLQWTFWIPGLVGSALLFLLLRFFYNEPAQRGLRPLGAEQAEPIQPLHAGPVAKIRARVFFQQARRTGAFWNLIGIHFWGCVGHNSILVFLPAMVVARGLSPAQAAAVYTTMYAASAVTRFAVPVLADRFGSKKAMLVCFSLQTFPLLLFMLGHEPWVLFLFAVLFGIGVGGEVPVFPVINRQYYGNAPMGTLYGWQNIGNGLGMALGPALGGWLWTQTGDYTGVLALSFAASLAGVLSILLLPGTSCCLLPTWEAQLPPEARSA